MHKYSKLVIFFTIFIDLIGFGIVIPIMPFYAAQQPFAATPYEIAWIFASYSIMQLIFSPILGKLSDRYGRKPILFFCMLGTGVSFVILAYANSLWMLFLGRMLDGVTGGNISTAQAYIADITTPEERAKGMGMIGAAFGLAFVVGPLLGGILSPMGFVVPFMFAAILSLVNAVLLLFVLPETVKPGTHTAENLSEGRWSVLFRFLREPKMAMIITLYFFVIVAFSIMTTGFSLYNCFRFEYTAKENGYLFFYIGILIVIMQGGLIGRLNKMFGEHALIIAGIFVLTLSLFFVPLVAPNWGGLAALLVGVAAFAIGQSIASPTLNTMASKHASADQQGSAMGVMQSSASLARAVGPAVTSILIYNAVAPGRASCSNIDDFSIQRTFWTAAGLMFVALLLAIYFSIKYKSAK
jgi:DHA1 family tetracycline resistance protein-like MFS transporter